MRKNLKREFKKVASSQDGAHMISVSGLKDTDKESSDELEYPISQDDILQITKMEKNKIGLKDKKSQKNGPKNISLIRTLIS